MMKQRIQNLLKGDPIIWAVVFLLSSLSILTVYSTSSSLAYRHMGYNTEYYLFRQCILVVGSLMAIWVAHRMDYRYYAPIAKWALWMSIPLLLVTWKYGMKLNQASRWLHIPWVNKSFQPSDLAQLALIIRLSHLLAKQQQVMHFRRSWLPILIWSTLISGLIGLTNFSGALLLFTTCLALMYVGRVPIKYLCMVILSGCLAGLGMVLVGQRGTTAQKRIYNFFKGDLPFQTQQAYIAISTGGILGKGPGHSTQRHFLPHPYSDFIYAILIEEYGLIGSIFVVSMYLILLYRAMHISAKAENCYGALLAMGVGMLLVFQALLNMSVSVGLGPVTGLALPFMSMGGTSLFFSGIGLGVLMSVSQGAVDPDFLDIQCARSGIRYNKYKKAAN